MAIISVDTKLLKQSANSLSDLSKKMNGVSSSLESINVRSFLDIKASPSLIRRISACNSEAEQYMRTLKGLSSALTSIAGTYERTERGLLVNVFLKPIIDAYKKNVMNVLWDVADSAIDLVIAPARLLKAFYEGGPVGLAKEEAFMVYDLYQDVAKIGSHLTGVVLAEIAGVSMLLGSSTYADLFLEASKEASEVSSASDAAALSGDKDMQKVLKTIETAHDGYEIIDDAVSFVKDPKKMIKGFIPGKYEQLDGKKYYDILNKNKTRAERVNEIKNYKKLYDIYGKQEAAAKVYKWGKNQVKNLIETGTGDGDYKEENLVIKELKNLKGVKFGYNVKDFLEDGQEVLGYLIS